MNEKQEITGVIYDIINTIKASFKPNAKKIPFETIVQLLQDLNSLFNELYKLDFTQTGEIIRAEYIPLLNLYLKIDKHPNNCVTYYQLLENAYKLSARTDLESFIIYYEWEERDKFYMPRYEILNGFVYYLNKMVFAPEFEGVIANLPSGWGKSFLVNLAAAFSYGVDDKGTILALCSNEDVVNGGSRAVKDIMQSERFGNVFPNLIYHKENREYYSKDTESEWKLKNCKLAASYYAKTTQSNVVGCRASKWVQIDDLYADYRSALNENDNIYYKNKFLTVWRKRFVQEAKVWKFIITGTMWSPTDFIVKMIDWLEMRYKFKPSKKFKYVRISEDEKFAIIQVPALNMETMESNCPALASTKTLLNEKASLDPYIWECNFQQNAVNPSSMAFAYNNLKTYKDKPANYDEGSYAVIDGTRKSGKDFFSMPIHIPYQDGYALIDCIYTQTATSKLHDAIIDMIVKHNVKILVIETNVDGGLKTAIEEKLKQRGYTNSIQLIELYNTVNKQVRIELERGNILDKIYYPEQGLFAPNSDMGKFMTSFTMYNIEGRNEHDDACFDGDTLIATQFGNKKIKDIKVGDKVITPFGLRKVTQCGITGHKSTINKFGLNVTANHKVFDKKNSKFTPIDTLTSFDECDTLSLKGLKLWKKKLKLYSLTEKNTEGIQKVDTILNTKQQIREGKTHRNYIEQCGNITTVKYQKDIKFIIKTKMSIIMTYLIWNVYLLGNIYQCIGTKCGKMKNTEKNIQKECKEILKFKTNVENGINQKKENNGINNIWQKVYLKINTQKIVYFVRKSLLRILKKQNIVVNNVQENIMLNKKEKKTKKLENANYVAKSLKRPNIAEKHIVLKNAQAEMHTKDVYNIKVENAGCYYANGILVSNCDSEAMFTSQIISGKAKPQKARPIQRPF